MTDHTAAAAQTAPPKPAPPSPAPPKPAAAWRPARSGWLAVIVFTLVIVAGVLAILAAWRLPPFTTPVERTEDAYVYGHTTVISPEVSGYVWKVGVEDFQHVRAGQVLVVIDPRTYQQQVAQAQAQLDAARTNFTNNQQNISRNQAEVAAKTAAIAGARAQVVRAVAELRRTSDLVRDGSVSERENEANVAILGQMRANLAEAQAGRTATAAQVRLTQVNGGSLQAAVEGAKAQVDAAKLQLERSVIRAPVDGDLSEVGVKLGQYVGTGTELFFIVPSERWVTANFKERQTRHMRPGQRAWFTVDALGEGKIYGRVERLSPATGSQFSVLKPDNATGNFTKVPQRISVRIAIDPHQPLAVRLKPGLSVEARVDTSGAS